MFFFIFGAIFLRKQHGDAHIKHHADDVVGDRDKRAGGNGGVYFQLFQRHGNQRAEDGCEHHHGKEADGYRIGDCGRRAEAHEVVDVYQQRDDGGIDGGHDGFKKNLEIKQRLCEAAEKLADEPDVVSAFHQWQKLNEEFRDTGPVAKEQRDEIWARFRAASTVVHKRHQQHFEALKERERNNLDQKTVICEIVEAIDCNELTTPSLWEEKAQEVIALQAKWKTIGYAPQKMNVQIYERFHKACDDFFHKRSEFFKSLKENMNANLEKKRALCEKAEALKDSTDWKATADELTKLQKEWKTIGPVNKRHSNEVWKRFITACDYFFEQRNKAQSSQRSQELENLEKKKAIIEQLNAIDEKADTEQASQQVRDLMKDWNSIGHVPIKEKDKIYKRYHAIVDKLFSRFNISASNRKLSNFKSSISAMPEGSNSQLFRERDKLVRTYENMKSELQTYENNLGFLNASSKKGNSLLNELNRKVEKLKADIELVKEKIKVLDESINSEKQA